MEGHTSATRAPLISRSRRPRVTVEQAAKLAAADVVRTCREAHPAYWLRWEANGQPRMLPPAPAPVTFPAGMTGRASVAVAVAGGRGHVRLAWRLGVASGVAELALIATRAINGGLSWLWLCPISGKVCRAVYLLPGAGQWASREAHGLRYAVQFERPWERAARKARRLRRALGQNPPAPPGSPPPDPPARMTATVYQRRLAAIREAEDAALAAACAPGRRSGGR
jgi:hypothetical protein